MPIQHRKKLSIDNNNAVNIGRNLNMQSLDNQEPLLSSSVSPPRKHVMIIGGSFAGLCAARHLSNNKDLDIWYFLSQKIIINFLSIVGFGKYKINYHKQLCKGKYINMYTIVAERTVPISKCFY